MIVESSILVSVAYRNRWAVQGAGDGVALVFTDHRHPGTLRLDPDGELLLRASVDIVDGDALAAAFPGWPVVDAVLRLPVDPPRGDAFLEALRVALGVLADLASDAAATAPPPPDAIAAAPETTRAQVILARRGQGLYRERLLAAWGGACAVTGLAEPAFLVASHAKPWSDATDAERLDGENGLPLVPNLDKLFDKGWISFDDDGAVLLSPALSAEAAAALGVTPSLRLRLPLSDRQKTYLRAHRDKVFKK